MMRRLPLQALGILLGGNTVPARGYFIHLMKHLLWTVSTILLLLPVRAQAVDPEAALPSSAAVNSERPLAEVKIGGNDRVEEEAIRVYLTSRAGEPLNPNAVDQDIRTIYK